MIQAINLSKSFGSRIAVDNISFSVEKGEAYGLLGPNGAGKSTTISMLFGLLSPDSGQIIIDDIPFQANPKLAKMKMGYVPQEIALYPELSAAENLLYWGRMYGLGGRHLAKRAEHSLEVVGLTDRAKHKVETYSGGMKRRLNIAVALLHNPMVLIMDEPTVGIDPQSRHHILQTVKQLNEEGMTVIYTSHYMEEVEHLCSRVGIIDQGKIIATGTVAELRKVVGDSSTLTLQVANISEGVLQALRLLPSIEHLAINESTIIISALDSAITLSEVAQLLPLHGASLRSVEIKEPNLESVFLHLTGRALRD
ncbi:MAG: ABC transporter ATP-binding protein [bacterium]|nr:ABC transporter ATP-binding protein [bacterium]